MKKYRVVFSVVSHVFVEGVNEEDALARFNDPDSTPTEELFKAMQGSIDKIGNDAVTIEDFWEVEEEDE
jgi:hypothetical protein